MPRLMADSRSGAAPHGGAPKLTSEAPLRKILIFLCVLALNATAIIPVLRNKGILPDNSYAVTVLQHARAEVLELTGNALRGAVAVELRQGFSAAPTRQTGLSSRVADTTIWHYRTGVAPSAAAQSGASSNSWRDRLLAAVGDSVSGPKASFKRSPHSALVDDIDFAPTAFTPIPAYADKPRWQRPAAALVDWRRALAAATDANFAKGQGGGRLAANPGEAPEPLAAAPGSKPASRVPGRH